MFVAALLLLCPDSSQQFLLFPRGEGNAGESVLECRVEHVHRDGGLRAGRSNRNTTGHGAGRTGSSGAVGDRDRGLTGRAGGALGCDRGGTIPVSSAYTWRNLPLDVGHFLPISWDEDPFVQARMPHERATRDIMSRRFSIAVLFLVGELDLRDIVSRSAGDLRSPTNRVL